MKKKTKTELTENDLNDKGFDNTEEEIDPERWHRK